MALELLDQFQFIYKVDNYSDNLKNNFNQLTDDTIEGIIYIRLNNDDRLIYPVIFAKNRTWHDINRIVELLGISDYIVTKAADGSIINLSSIDNMLNCSGVFMSDEEAIDLLDYTRNNSDIEYDIYDRIAYVEDVIGYCADCRDYIINNSSQFKDIRDASINTTDYVTVDLMDWFEEKDSNNND